MNVNNVNAALSALILLQSDKGKANAVKAQKDSVAAQCRTLVIETVTAGLDVDKVSAAYVVAAKAAGVPEGTGKAYRKAMLGYGLAIASGVDITTGFGKGEVKNKPMPVKAAQDFHTEQTASEGEKMLAELRADLRELVGPYLRDADAETLRELIASIPAMQGEAKTERGETATERKARELREAAEAAMQAAGLSGESESIARVAQAA